MSDRCPVSRPVVFKFDMEMSAPDETSVKEALLAAKHLAAARELNAADTLARLDLQERPTLSANRREVERLLGDAVAKLHIDWGRLETLRAQSQVASNEFHEARRAEAIKHSPTVAKDFARGIESSRQAIEALRAADFKPVVENIAAPFLISATPPSILTDSQIEPFNSRAKFFFTSTADVEARDLSFHYLWRNPSDRFAVINIDGYLTLNGFCRAQQDGGFFAGDRQTTLGLTATMTPWEWWNQPPTLPLFQLSQTERVLTLTASARGILDDAATESRAISRPTAQGYNLLLVPPSGMTVIEYRLTASSSSGKDGDHRVLFDFDSGDFRVTSPFVTIQILT